MIWVKDVSQNPEFSVSLLYAGYKEPEVLRKQPYLIVQWDSFCFPGESVPATGVGGGGQKI